MRLREDGITWQEIDGELVILDLNRSTYLTTNQSGAFVAKLLQSEHSLDELADAMVAEFAIPRESAMQDAEAFVASLRERDLLV